MYSVKGQAKSVSKPKPRAPKEIIRLLRDALECAKLEHCGVDNDAQEKMRLYLDTWVAHRISSALKYLEGELSADDLNPRRYYK